MPSQRQTTFRPPSESPSPEEIDLLSQSFLGGEKTKEETGQSLIAASFDLLNQEHLWIPSTTEPEPEQRTPETTDTQNSYPTVPELSELTKQFFNTLLEQKKSEVVINMTGESSEEKTVDKMNVDEPERKRELKLNQPKTIYWKKREPEEVSSECPTLSLCQR